jgi:hypothetical protein
MLAIPDDYKKFAESHFSKNVGILPYYSIVASMLYQKNQTDLDAITTQNVRRVGRSTTIMFDTVLQTAVKVNVLVIDHCKKELMKELKMHPPSDQFKIVLYEYNESLQSAVFFPLVTENVLFSKDESEFEIKKFFESPESKDCLGLGSYVFYDQKHWKIIKQDNEQYVLESLDDSTKNMIATKSDVTKVILPAQSPEQLQNRADYYKESDNVYINKVTNFLEYVNEQNAL